MFQKDFLDVNVTAPPDVGLTFRTRRNRLSLSQRRRERAIAEASIPGEHRTADEIYTEKANRNFRDVRRQSLIERRQRDAPDIDGDLILASRDDDGIINWHTYNQLYINKYHKHAPTYDAERDGDIQRDNTQSTSAAGGNTENIDRGAIDSSLHSASDNGSDTDTSIPDPIVEAYRSVRGVLSRYNPGGSVHDSSGDISTESEFLAELVRLESAVCWHICPLPVHIFITDLDLQ